MFILNRSLILKFGDLTLLHQSFIFSLIFSTRLSHCHYLTLCSVPDLHIVVWSYYILYQFLTLLFLALMFPTNLSCGCKQTLHYLLVFHFGVGSSDNPCHSFTLLFSDLLSLLVFNIAVWPLYILHQSAYVIHQSFTLLFVHCLVALCHHQLGGEKKVTNGRCSQSRVSINPKLGKQLFSYWMILFGAEPCPVADVSSCLSWLWLRMLTGAKTSTLISLTRSQCPANRCLTGESHGLLTTPWQLGVRFFSLIFFQSCQTKTIHSSEINKVY